MVIGGAAATGRERERVVRILDAVREIAGRLQPRPGGLAQRGARDAGRARAWAPAPRASAALAAAAMAAAFGPEVVGDTRLLSATARLLAGSGCRSAVGGVSLWLSYPGIAHEESVAVRLDAAGELDDLRLVTVPLDSRIGLKTEQAHDDAPHSPFFRPWMLSRGDEIIDCAEAVWRGDWRRVGQLAELDSIRLHGVTMSGSLENKLFAWEPENIALFRLCNDLRDAGAPVYFSTDTGPTTVFLTHRDHEGALVRRWRACTALGDCARSDRWAGGACSPVRPRRKWRVCSASPLEGPARLGRRQSACSPICAGSGIRPGPARRRPI